MISQQNSAQTQTSNLIRLKDKQWRMSNLYKIVDKDANLVTFRRNAAQQHYAKNWHPLDIILKSRRLGFTTDSALDMTDDTLFSKNFSSLFLSYDDPSSKKVFDDIVMRAWNHFPFQSSYKVDTSNANQLKLNFGDKTVSSIEVKSSGRGGGYNRIHISEFAKICAKYANKAAEILSGTIPSLTPNGRLAIESTAEGETGDFHDMFWAAWERTTSNVKLSPKEYKAHFYNWQWEKGEISKITQPEAQMPKDFLDYQKKHNEKVKKFPLLYKPISDIELTWWFYKYVQGGRKWSLLLQEFPTTPEEAFISSGSKLFDSIHLEWQKQFFTTPTEAGSWLFYEDPKPNHSYIISADPSEGVSRDHSAIVILDITPTRPRIVAIFKNNQIAPDMLAYEVANKGRVYNFAFAMVERNNMGFATLTQLKKIYPVEYIYKEENDKNEATETTERLGWHTNLVSKPKMFYELSTAFNDHLIESPCSQVVHEARLYDRNTLQRSKADPDATNHFDLLTALAIAFQGRYYFQQLSSDIRPISPSREIQQQERASFDPYAGV